MSEDAQQEPKFIDFPAAYDRYPGLQFQPISRRILVENLMRHTPETSTTDERVKAIATGKTVEIDFRPARILMQDYAGMPALIDLAGLRSSAAKRGINPASLNPAVPVDLVIDHSVMANATGTPDAISRNMAHEYAHNLERYSFLKWAAQAFKGLRVVPPGRGIVHQINTEILASVVTEARHDGDLWWYPDTLVGTDSHTTMINGIGVLGWGVGGIEAEAVMLGEPVSIITPPVVAVELRGRAPKGILATDVVLTLTEFLRNEEVVGTIVEFYGPGIATLPAADRLTISNMSPEFGSTAAFFPTDNQTLAYLTTTGRSEAHIDRIASYLRRAGMYYDPEFRPTAERHLSFDLSTVARAVSGPKQPNERHPLSSLPAIVKGLGPSKGPSLRTGDIVIASITSCTNTSNPEAMIAAGLLARAARQRGLTVSRRIKTSLAPGSRAVRGYLRNLGLLEDLEALGFHIVAFGCTTCVGNSGELDRELLAVIEEEGAIVASVLSGNRNFEARIHPQIRANFLASPPLVIAYALAGTMEIDLNEEPIGSDQEGRPVMLDELWPENHDVQAAIRSTVTADLFQETAAKISDGGSDWQRLDAPRGADFAWNANSTYLCKPPFFDQGPLVQDSYSLVKDARPLLLLGDGITTDHISPVGRIARESPAALYLSRRGVAPEDFNTYGARRGNHEVMTRGAFANTLLENRLTDRRGGWTRMFPSGKDMTIFDAAKLYAQQGERTVVLAGRQYGAGSARDWAAKGTRLLGVVAVIAESFERIHRANLVRMGILPVQLGGGSIKSTFNSGADPRVSIKLLGPSLVPRAELQVELALAEEIEHKPAVLAIETQDEIAYLVSGGILPFVAERLFQNIDGAHHE